MGWFLYDRDLRYERVKFKDKNIRTTPIEFEMPTGYISHLYCWLYDIFRNFALVVTSNLLKVNNKDIRTMYYTSMFIVDFEKEFSQ